MYEATPAGGSQIEKVLNTTLSRLKTMMDSKTVFGDAYHTEDGTTIIPISRVTVGYVAGGGEYNEASKKAEEYPFAGGSGACVAMTPIGFLVGSGTHLKLINMEGGSPVEKMMELTVSVLDKLNKK